MAARIEVIGQEVIVKDRDRLLGKGPGVYELRNYDPEIDIDHRREPKIPGSRRSLTLRLEKDHDVHVRTRDADTSVITDGWVQVASSDLRIRVNGGVPIFGEAYGEIPRPYPVVNFAGDVLAVVTHLSRQEAEKCGLV